MGYIEKSLGGLPGRKSASGELPAKRMAGLFYPRSASLGLSGPLWASASQPKPASQPASSLVVILLEGHWGSSCRVCMYCVVLLSANFGPRGKLRLQLSVLVLSSLCTYVCMYIQNPERPREAQRGPERPGDAQRGPERPREAQRSPEKPRRIFVAKDSS